MDVKLTHMMRGDGVGAVDFAIDGVPADARLMMSAHLANGEPIPFRLMDVPVVRDASGGRRCRAIVPLFSEADYLFELAARVGDDVVARSAMRLSPLEFKWRSRLTRLAQALPAGMASDEEEKREGALVLADDPMRLSFRQCIPDGERLVVRLRLEGVSRQFAGFSQGSGSFAVSALSAQGDPVDVESHFMGEVLVEYDELSPDTGWAVDFSVVIPSSCVEPCFLIRGENGDTAAREDEFRTFEQGRRDQLIGEYYAEALDAYHDPAYDEWFRRNRVSDAEWKLQRQHEFPYEPLVSIVVPLFDTPAAFFADMYSSVACQSYENWELVLVNASPHNERLAAMLAGIDDERVLVVGLEGNQGIAGNIEAGLDVAHGEFVSFLDHDDMLEPDTLFAYVKAINADPSVDMLYCDEDSWSPTEGYTRAHFKTDFNLDLLYTHNYITHFLMIRATVVHEAGVSPAYVEGAQDYDLILRVVNLTKNIVHIPRVLYHWRSHEGSTSVNTDSKRYAQEAGRRALADHFERRGLNVEVEDGPEPFTYANRYKMRATPKVSIIIPNKDHEFDLRRCVYSILSKSTYPNYEVVIVENNSTDVTTFTCYDELARDARVRVVHFPESFNFSRVVNFGVRRSVGEYLLLLNNDTEVITPDFIERLIGRFVRSEVGIVGAKLLFADGTVQHAGIVAGPFSGPWHMYVNAPDSYGGYMFRANLSQNYVAVTGACQMVKRRVYEAVGGYDEAYEVGYGDVDFCLRARDLGYLTVYDPEVKLYHREYASRGHDVTLERRVRAFGELTRLQSRWPRLYIEGDPYYNVNLDVSSQYGALGT